jgi:hypothetical protein
MDTQRFPNKIESLSRRHFARDAATAVAITVLPAARGAAEQTAPTTEETLGSRPEGLSAADWNEVHAKYSNLLRVYNERLSVDEKHRLVKILTKNQHMLASIRSFEVQNGDPSACTLRLYP